MGPSVYGGRLKLFSLPWHMFQQRGAAVAQYNLFLPVAVLFSCAMPFNYSVEGAPLHPLSPPVSAFLLSNKRERSDNIASIPVNLHSLLV